MSSILPFVVVASCIAIVAAMAVNSGVQPATDSGLGRRDPWRERLRPVVHWCIRSSRDVRTWLLAGLGAIGRWRRDRRERRASARSERRTRKAALRIEAAPEAVTPTALDSPSAPRVGAEPPKPDGVVTTALRVKPDIAVAETIGDEVKRTGPGFFVRVRSALGLALLIALLGLTLAAVLAAAAAAVGAGLDSFVN